MLKRNRPSFWRVPLLGTLAAALVVPTAAASLLVGDPARASAIAPGAVEVHYSSESSTVAPKARKWFKDPEYGVSGIPYSLDEQPEIALTDPTGITESPDGDKVFEIKINPSNKHQTMLGFGTSLEESTVFNLSLMSPAKRTEVLTTMIDPVNGSGMNVLRITFGASDFTGRDFYTYEDERGNFSIQKDLDYNIIATVKEAIRIGEATDNPVKLFASAWTAPEWMKQTTDENGNNFTPIDGLVGGWLNSAHIGDLAQYYRKAIQAYLDQGISLYAMTLQNEPTVMPIDYPGMKLTPNQQRELAIAVRGELDAHGLHGVKLWGLDDNIGNVEWFMESALSDPVANAAIDGLAFHDYYGDPSIMGNYQNNPLAADKDFVLTERAVWGTRGADRILQYLRNNATSYVSWVTMLDQDIAPEQFTAVPDASLFVRSTGSDPDKYWATPEVSIIGQFSKFIQPGAKRIDSDYGDEYFVTNASFLNPDNTIASVVVNQTSADQHFVLLVDGKEISAKIPKKTVATYVWQRDASLAAAPVGSTIAINSAVNDRYVSAAEGGAAPLIADRSAVAAWEKFEVVDAGGDYVALRSLANNKYVTSEDAGKKSLIADRTAIGEWERFRWFSNEDGTFSLLSLSNMRYVQAAQAGVSPLVASAKQIGTWEKFTLFVQ